MRASEWPVVVTGAGGFVGSYLVGALARAGWRVVGIYHRAVSVGLRAYASEPRVTLRQCDLTASAPMPAGARAVIHAAGRIYAPTLGEYLADNVRATQVVLDSARRAGVGKFVLLSTVSVHGEISASSVDESTPIVNPTPYGMSKLWTEWLVREAAGELDGIALRLPGILGAGASGPWLARVFNSARSDSAIELFNPDAPFNNVLHIGDLTRFILQLLEASWSGFDAVALGCAEPMSIRDTVQAVKRLCGSASRIVERPELRPWFTISAARAVRRYGYQPRPLMQVLQAHARDVLPEQDRVMA